MFKKFLAILMTAVIAMVALGVTAFAADDNVLKNGKAVNAAIGFEGCAEYIFNASSSGTLEISYSFNRPKSTLSVLKDGIDDIKIQSVKVGDGCEILEGGKGKTYVKGYYNTSTKKYNISATYNVSKGSYTVRLVNDAYNASSANCTIKATLKTNSGENTANGKPQYFTIDMKKGSTLQLGAVVTEKGGKYDYSSSKESVATVSSKGKVTAKSKGSTVITLKYGKGSIKLKINVV